MTISARHNRRPFLPPVWSAVFILAILSLPSVSPGRQLEGATLMPRDGFSPSKRLVIISAVLSGTDTPSLERAISAQLADLRIEVVFHHSPTLPPDMALRDELAVSLMTQHHAFAAFIIIPNEKRVDIRIVQLGKTGVEAAQRPVDVTQGAPQHEALAIIVRSTAMAILEQREPPSAAPTAETAPPSKLFVRISPNAELRTVVGKRPHLFGEVGGVLGLFAAKTSPWFGMAVGVGAFPIRNLLVHLGFVAFSKVERRAHSLSLTIDRHPIYVGLGYHHSFRRLFWGGGVSMVLDYMTAHTTSGSDRVVADSAVRNLNLVLAGYLQVGARIVGPVSLLVSAGGEIPVRNSKYSLKALNGSRTVISPLFVQPLFKIGLRVDFF